MKMLVNFFSARITRKIISRSIARPAHRAGLRSRICSLAVPNYTGGTVAARRFKVLLRNNLCSLILLCLVVIAGCSEAAVQKFTQIQMGTFVNISIIGQNRKSVDLAFARIGEIEDLMSKFKSASEVSRLNQNAFNAPVKVNPELLHVIKESIRYTKLTDGAFDITVGPLIKLWGFDNQNNSEPSQSQINETLKAIGADKIILDETNSSVKLANDKVRIDLGGIAAGYSVDEAVKSLKENNVSNAIIDNGGDIYCLGKGPTGIGWKIGIAHPRKQGKLIASLYVSERAVSTSGDYEKFFQGKSKRFSHIINPKTGQPVADSPCSVTIIGPDCISADALATACFVLGPHKSMKLIEGMPGYDAIIISSSGMSLNIIVSKGLKDKVRFGP